VTAIDRTRLEVLQWFGLLAAPLTWAVQLVVGYGVADTACGPVGMLSGLTIGSTETVLLAIGVAVALAAEAAAVAVLRQLRTVDHDAPGPLGRLRFFASAALVGNVLFLAIIVMSGVGAIALSPCHQG
jgi:hypothetical protein